MMDEGVFKEVKITQRNYWGIREKKEEEEEEEEEKKTYRIV